MGARQNPQNVEVRDKHTHKTWIWRDITRGRKEHTERHVHTSTDTHTQSHEDNDTHIGAKTHRYTTQHRHTDTTEHAHTRIHTTWTPRDTYHRITHRDEHRDRRCSICCEWLMQHTAHSGQTL